MPGRHQRHRAAISHTLAIVVATTMVSSQTGSIRFDEVAAASGVHFVLDQAPTPEKRLIETMPGGLAAFDYNGDGRVDLYFTNGASGDGFDKAAPRFWNRLFRNDGQWRFTDVTESAGVAGATYAMGAAAADYDNDGDQDLFVAGVGRNQLLRNDGGGRFTDVAEAPESRKRCGASRVSGSITIATAASICSSSTTSGGHQGLSASVETGLATFGSTVIRILRGPAQHALSEHGRRPLPGRHTSGWTGRDRRQGDERRHARHRRRPLARSVRDQRQRAEPAVAQYRQGHFRGDWPAGRCRAAGARTPDFGDGRGRRRCRRRWPSGPGGDGAGGRDVPALPQRGRRSVSATLE